MIIVDDDGIIHDAIPRKKVEEMLEEMAEDIDNGDGWDYLKWRERLEEM